MTFWAKLLTIVLFVLSIVLAAVSGVIFAKREDYRVQLINAKRAHADEAAKLNLQVQEKDRLLETKKSELEKVNAKLNSEKLQKEGLQGEVAKLNGQVGKLQADIASWKDKAGELAQSHKALVETNTTLMKENEGIRKENRGYAEDLRAKREPIAALAEANIQAQVIIGKQRITPDLKAKVASVDPTLGLVVLNRGSDDGVKKNFEFTVFRDDKFIATVNVFALQSNYSAARVVTKKGEIELGDDAWTRLP